MVEKVEVKEEPPNDGNYDMYNSIYPAVPQSSYSCDTQDYMKNVAIIVDPSGTKRFKCCFCDRMFTRRDKSKRHIMEIHYAIKNFQCTTCMKRFSRNDKLLRHIKEVHEGRKRFFCQWCDKKFSRVWEYQNHFKTSIHGKRCSFLSDIVKQDLLKQAPKAAIGELAASKLEETDITTAQKLDSTLFVDLELDEEHIYETMVCRPFKCSTCGRGFTRSEKLTRHEREIHGGPKEFVCNICSKAFHRRENLTKHIEKLHPDTKLLKCPICSQDVIGGYNFHEHMLTAHPSNVKPDPENFH